MIFGNIQHSSVRGVVTTLDASGVFDKIYANELYASGVPVAGGSEDTIARGFEMVYNSTTSVDINPGVLFHGTNRVYKSSTTTLSLGTASHWYDGSTHSYSGGAGWCYVGVDNAGNIRLLHTNAPDKTDPSGGTTGVKLYWYYAGGGKYYRVIGAMRINTSDNIAFKWYQRGRQICYDFTYNATDTTGRVLNGGNATSFTAVDASAIVPSISTMLDLESVYYTVYSNTFAVRPTGSSSTYGQLEDACAGNNQKWGPCGVLTNSSQSFDYKVGNGGGTISVWVIGYTLDIR